MINGAMEPFGVADGRAGAIVITGENIRFPPKAALALGIAFHELATNAVKYGAFSNEAGSILIEWTTEPAPEGNRLLLRWQEKDGPRSRHRTQRIWPASTNAVWPMSWKAQRISITGRTACAAR